MKKLKVEINIVQNQLRICRNEDKNKNESACTSCMYVEKHEAWDITLVGR